MSNRRMLDGQRGALPEIRHDNEGVKFLIEMATVRQTPRLVLRCDPDGNVWASIAATGSPEPHNPDATE